MLQARHDPCLTLETRELMLGRAPFQQDFYRDVTEKLKVLAPPYFPHPAAADQLVQAIPSRQDRPGFHGCVRLPVAGQRSAADLFIRRAA
jgi:hypothetical protein